MRVHLTSQALKEILVAAELCLSYEKDGFKWHSNGNLGFPTAILLLSFIDSVGYILTIKDTVNDADDDSIPGKSFEIVRDKKYFESPLSKMEKEKLYHTFRNPVIHSATLKIDHGLSWSSENRTKIIEKWDQIWLLNLDVLYSACKKLYLDNEDEIISKTI